MALTHLVDTRVLKRLDRPSIQQVVGRLGRADALARSSLADLEVGFSARTAAAAAESRGLTVLHYDADFDRIAAVTGQAVEWVVPRGSVD